MISSMRPEDEPLRVLFVDDEQAVLDGLERSLFGMNDDEWEFDFALEGEAALALVEEDEFQVIVSDMKMPKMDGAELLKQIAERHPETLRIILSGHTEIDAAMRAIPYCHQFLSKPTKAKDLVETIQQGLRLRQVVANPQVRTAAGEVKYLPPRPSVYHRLCHLLQQEDSSLSDLGEVVEQDLGISTKLLHVANNSFFNRGNRVRSVREAVTRVGPRVVRDVALGTEAFGSFSSVNAQLLDQLTTHSFQVATVARELAETKEEKELAFTAGLLHDVGRLIQIWKHPNAVKQIQQFISEGLTHREAELKAMEVTHSELGAYLLSLWALPYPVVEAVLYHHTPDPKLTSSIIWVVSAAEIALMSLEDPHSVEDSEQRLMSSESGSKLYERALGLAQSEDLFQDGAS